MLTQVPWPEQSFGHLFLMNIQKYRGYIKILVRHSFHMYTWTHTHMYVCIHCHVCTTTLISHSPIGQQTGPSQDSKV